MARRSTKRPASASRPASSTRAASTRRGPGGAPAATAEEEGGMGLEGAIAITTTVVLLAACLMVDYFLGTTYGAGVFFK